MGDKVILLDQFVSIFGMRARVALAAKGVVYEYREQDLRNKSQLLLQSNPIHKQIPVLIHNGKPVCESLIILEYIDEVWNQEYPLLPPHPYHRAQARFWAHYIDKQLYGAGRKIWSTGSEEELEAGKKELVETLKQLESQLGEEAFFGGERLGFLDVALVTYSTWFHTYEMCAGFSIQEHCPKLTQWVKRCLEIDFVSESLADPAKIYDFVLVIRKVLGLHTSGGSRILRLGVREMCIRLHTRKRQEMYIRLHTRKRLCCGKDSNSGQLLRNKERQPLN